MDFFTAENMREVNDFIEMFKTLDDRSCVIVAAAHIESLLRQALEKRLLAPRSKNKDGIDHLQFSGCVSMSYRVGLVHSTHANALDALAKLRNMVAHFDRPVSLEDGQYETLIRAFSSPWELDRQGSAFYDWYQAGRAAFENEARAAFYLTACVFVVFLSPLAHVADRITPLHFLRRLS